MTRILIALIALTISAGLLAVSYAEQRPYSYDEPVSP